MCTHVSFDRSHESVVQMRPSSHIESFVQQFGILKFRQLCVNESHTSAVHTFMSSHC